MDQPTRRYFETLTDLIGKALDNIRLNQIESDSRRTLWGNRKALQLKYGLGFTSHLDELIPHRHDKNKTILELTEDMTVEKFLKSLITI